MKKIIISLVAMAPIYFVACNNGSEKKTAHRDSASMGNMNVDTTVAIDTSKLTKIKPTFDNIDPKIGTSINSIVSNYLDIKNALSNDNGTDAASSSKKMLEVITNLDKSLLTVPQKNIYTDIEDDLQENAEHISKNANDIDHQREHFSWMSEDLYDLVKAFGGGRVLYADFCPMYNDGKGALWLSEMTMLKNPYYGNKMPKCGNVKAIIKP